MQIGIYLRLMGRPGTPPPPNWPSLRTQTLAAEAAGFDLVVLEDASVYPDEQGDLGLWEAVVTAGAVAATTTRIRLAHAVLNNPYRHPAQTARIAATLDEVSAGRYTFGIGLGNTPDDYPRFGIAADHRFSRFDESIRIIRPLLRGERVTFEGSFYAVDGAELILRGPSQTGPPLAIAAGKPKMLRLTAEFADEWNWWTAGPEGTEDLRRLGAELDEACREVGRDPASIRRSVDLYSVRPPAPAGGGRIGDDWPIGGTTEEIAAALLAYSRLGFDEVRINLAVPDDLPRTEAIARMSAVVDLVHEAA